MPSLNELARVHTDLDDDAVAWLHLLLADWQIVADLSFADLVLWLPDRRWLGFWAGAQMRPTTGPTAFVDDLVGAFVPKGRRPLLDAAYDQQRVAREGDPEWRDDIPVRVEAIPVRRGDRILAVVARNTNLLGVRTPSRLELAYLESATELTRMISRGFFPFPGPRSHHADSPRVGDGFVRVDADGRVGYASPNALSVYRRLGLAGDLTGLDLAETTRRLVPVRRRPDEETLSAVLGGRVPSDIEVGNDDAAVIARALPLRPDGEHSGAGATAGRHRAAQPRPGTGHQGRDHPRDPPPREEQPADRRRPSAAAGTQNDGARRASGVRRWRRRYGAWARSPSCTTR